MSFMSLGKNGFLTPWLQPGEQKRPKTKRLQPLKRLNTKATKNVEKINRRAFRWNPFGKSIGEKSINALKRAVKLRICRTPTQIAAEKNQR